MMECVRSSEENQVDLACAFFLGMLFFFNDDNKMLAKVPEKVRDAGFTRGQVHEAIMLLASVHLIESHMSSSCFKRKVTYSLTGYAKSMPVGDLFAKVNSLHGSQNDLDQIEDATAFVIRTAAKTALV